MLKVSLLVSTFNSKNDISVTLDSIEMQDYPLIEVAIKDGGSTDGTLEMIKEYSQKSRHSVVFSSGKDNGIYDAMNEAYKLSSGDVIAIMNDKYTVPDAVSKMVKCLEEHPETVGVHSDLNYLDEQGQIVRFWHMGEQKSLFSGWMPGHPTLFLKREIYEKYGFYKTDFKIAADYEFMIRFLKDRDNKLAYVPETLIAMFYGGTSNKSFGSYMISLKEGHRALTQNHIHPAFVIDCIRTCRVLLQFVKRPKAR